MHKAGRNSIYFDDIYRWYYAQWERNCTVTVSQRPSASHPKVHRIFFFFFPSKTKKDKKMCITKKGENEILFSWMGPVLYSFFSVHLFRSSSSSSTLHPCRWLLATTLFHEITSINPGWVQSCTDGLAFLTCAYVLYYAQFCTLPKRRRILICSGAHFLGEDRCSLRVWLVFAFVLFVFSLFLRLTDFSLLFLHPSLIACLSGCKIFILKEVYPIEG